MASETDGVMIGRMKPWIMRFPNTLLLAVAGVTLAAFAAAEDHDWAAMYPRLGLAAVLAIIWFYKRRPNA